jgi:transcriptional regulator with XRE-family HTH domain
MEEFGRRVRAQRHRKGWSLETLAEVAGMHFTYVGGIERGRRNVSLNNIVKLAEALEVDPGRLVKGLPVPKKPSRGRRREP